MFQVGFQSNEEAEVTQAPRRRVECPHNKPEATMATAKRTGRRHSKMFFGHIFHLKLKT